MAAKVARDLVKEIDELALEDLEGGYTPSKSRLSAKETAERNQRRNRESIDRIKAKAIEEGTMRADPTLTVRYVDPATLRPPEPAPAPKRAKPVYDIEEEKPVDTPPRPVGRAAMDAAGLPDEPVPASESLRGRRPAARPAAGTFNPPKHEKTCKRCHLSFVPRGGNQRYCDREECRTRECKREGCEVRFAISSAQPSQKFCSQECSQLALVKAPDSNPEEAQKPPAAPPGAGELPAEPDPAPEPHDEAESEPDEPSSAGLEAQGAREGPPALARDFNQDLEAAAQGAETADERYVELLYGLVLSSSEVGMPVELRIKALEQLHDLWADRAVLGSLDDHRRH